MKKLLVPAFVLAFALPAFALGNNPVSKGRLAFSLPLFQIAAASGDAFEGDMGITDSLAIGPGNTGFEMSGAELGRFNYGMGFQYFVIDSLAVGADFGYSKVKADGSSTYKTLTLSPNATYYVPLGKLFPYVGGSLEYKHVDMDSQDYSIFMPQVKGGVLVPIKGFLSAYVEASLGYQTAKYDDVSIHGTLMAVTSGMKFIF